MFMGDRLVDYLFGLWFVLAVLIVMVWWSCLLFLLMLALCLALT